MYILLFNFVMLQRAKESRELIVRTNKQINTYNSQLMNEYKNRQILNTLSKSRVCVSLYKKKYTSHVLYIFQDHKDFSFCVSTLHIFLLAPQPFPNPCLPFFFNVYSHTYTYIYIYIHNKMASISQRIIEQKYSFDKLIKLKDKK